MVLNYKRNSKRCLIYCQLTISSHTEFRIIQYNIYFAGYQHILPDATLILFYLGFFSIIPCCFHYIINSCISDVEKFLIEELKHDKLGKTAKNRKQEIIDKICKLKEKWPQLGTAPTTEQVKQAKGLITVFSN